MSDELESHVRQRLITIQTTHNFSPRLGARQVQDKPHLAKAYGNFEELLKLIRKLNLGVPIPYAPDGQTFQEIPARADRTRYVYFIREEDRDSWKVGYSEQPFKRAKGLQTANSRSLCCGRQVEGGYPLEQRLHAYLKHFHIRGEWYALNVTTIRRLIRKLKEEGPDFLDSKPPRTLASVAGEMK